MAYLCLSLLMFGGLWPVQADAVRPDDQDLSHVKRTAVDIAINARVVVALVDEVCTLQRESAATRAQHRAEMWLACASGPAIPANDYCRARFDRDSDGDVDADDFGELQRNR